MLGTRKSLENSSTAVSSIPNIFILKGGRSTGWLPFFIYIHPSFRGGPAGPVSLVQGVCLFFIFFIHALDIHCR